MSRAIEQLLNDPEFPATRGELTEWLCEKLQVFVTNANFGNGFCNDTLLAVFGDLSDQREIDNLTPLRECDECGKNKPAWVLNYEDICSDCRKKEE